MSTKTLHKILTFCISFVWLANGLFCKILNLVPRHQQIVARILGDQHSRTLTILIGIFETAMAIWIVSGIKPRFNTLAQIIVVATMNTIEFIMAPDLLLWGRFNAVFALLFILVVYYNEFYLNKKIAQAK
jgi:uncharacterized membrane protein YphA (DoxX/SURF4 family)